MDVRIVAFALSAFLVAGCAATGPVTRPTVGGPSGPQAPLPTYALGERWIRDDGAFELVRVEGDVYVFATARGSEIHLSRQLTPVKHQIAAGATWEFQPALPLEWPLQVGKRGTAPGQFRIPHTVDGWVPAKSSWAVEAEEDIRTPAGPFRALRVVVSIERTSDGSKYEYRTWYAPSARQFVKTESALWGFPFQVVSIDRPEAHPLQVVVHEPPDQTHATTDRTTVVGRVTGGGGVASVVVSVNGVRVTPPDPRAEVKDTVALSVPITLTDGRNVVLVTATDARGNTRQEGRVVFYDRPRAAPAPSGTAAPVPAPLSTVPPVSIQIARPGNQTRFESESIAMAGYISGGKGLRRAGVALNGQEVWHTDPGVTTWRTVTLDVPVKLRDGQNTLVVTVTESDGTPYQEVRTVFFERTVPLTVHVTYPTDGVVVTQPSAVVAGEIRTSKGIAKASVLVNGIPMTLDNLPDGSRAVDVSRLRKEASLTIPITLADGGNVVVIRAEEPDGTAREEIRTLTYQAPPFLLRPPTAAATPPVVAERWAVIVGIDNYDAPGITKLRYAVSDAEAIHRVLTGPGGFKKENVLLLTDRTERKPTLRNIKWALGTFLARSAKPEDTVLIFFAGHGAPEVDEHAADPDGLSKYLVPIDADAEDLYSTALAMDEVQNVFGRIRADRTIMFIDAGYGGTAEGRSFAAKKMRPTAMDDRFLERVTRSRGRVIVTAAQPLDVTRELDELRHGLFTYYLVRGLEGAADADGDGVVTLQELYAYVEREVRDKSRATGSTQRPVMKGELEGSVPVIRAAAPPAGANPPR